MFGIGFFELVIIGIAILIVVGPDKLPHVMGHFAKLYREFARFKNDLHYQMSAFEEEVVEKKKEAILMVDPRSEPRTSLHHGPDQALEKNAQKDLEDKNKA